MRRSGSCDIARARSHRRTCSFSAPSSTSMVALTLLVLRLCGAANVVTRPFAAFPPAAHLDSRTHHIFSGSLQISLRPIHAIRRASTPTVHLREEHFLRGPQRCYGRYGPLRRNVLCPYAARDLTTTCGFSAIKTRILSKSFFQSPTKTHGPPAIGAQTPASRSRASRPLQHLDRRTWQTLPPAARLLFPSKACE